jgi:hypothetical protein
VMVERARARQTLYPECVPARVRAPGTPRP